MKLFFFFLAYDANVQNMQNNVQNMQDMQPKFLYHHDAKYAAQFAGVPLKI